MQFQVIYAKDQAIPKIERIQPLGPSKSMKINWKQGWAQKAFQSVEKKKNNLLIIIGIILRASNLP